MSYLITLFAASCLAICGCVVVPVPSKTLEEYIPKDKLAFLEVGNTTKDEAFETLARPASTFSNGSTWVYRANLRETNRLAMCYYTKMERGCGVEPLYQKYGLLALTFDDRGVLSDWKLSYAQLGGCSKEGVCGFSGGYMIFAPKTADRSAKRFRVSGDNCAIYLYPHKGFFIWDDEDPARVQIEGVFDTWWRETRETYLYRVLPAASYIVSTTHRNLHGSIQLDCNAGDIVFVRFVREDFREDDFYLETATESDGKAAIEDRKLLLFEDIQH